MLLLSILVPFFWGLFLLLAPEFRSRKALIAATGLGLVIAAALGFAAFRLFEKYTGEEPTIPLEKCL